LFILPEVQKHVSFLHVEIALSMAAHWLLHCDGTEAAALLTNRKALSDLLEKPAKDRPGLKVDRADAPSVT